MEAKQYFEVRLDSLKVGMLLDRPLFIYLASNERYIQLTKPLSPLDEKDLEKMRKIGKIFSDQKGIDDQYPELSGAAQKTCEILENKDMRFAPFEVEFYLREKLEWLRPILFTKFYRRVQREADVLVPVFFVSRILSVPSKDLLELVAGKSVVHFEQGLRFCGHVGALGLFSGFNDLSYLRALTQQAFLLPYIWERSPSDEELKNFGIEFSPFLLESVRQKKIPSGIDLFELLKIAYHSSGLEFMGEQSFDTSMLTLWTRLKNTFKVEMQDQSRPTGVAA